MQLLKSFVLLVVICCSVIAVAALVPAKYGFVRVTAVGGFPATPELIKAGPVKIAVSNDQGFYRQTESPVYVEWGLLASVPQLEPGTYRLVVNFRNVETHQSFEVKAGKMTEVLYDVSTKVASIRQ